jgi:hypothetical protein
MSKSIAKVMLTLGIMFAAAPALHAYCSAFWCNDPICNTTVPVGGTCGSGVCRATGYTCASCGCKTDGGAGGMVICKCKS